MLSYQNLFISLLLFFCCYATYTDLRERKIKNFCSYGLIYAGILSQVIAVLSGSSALLNSIFTIVGGFLIVLVRSRRHCWGQFLLCPGMGKIRSGCGTYRERRDSSDATLLFAC